MALAVAMSLGVALDAQGGMLVMPEARSSDRTSARGERQTVGQWFSCFSEAVRRFHSGPVAVLPSDSGVSVWVEGSLVLSTPRLEVVGCIEQAIYWDLINLPPPVL